MADQLAIIELARLGKAYSRAPVVLSGKLGRRTVNLYRYAYPNPVGKVCT